MSEDLCDAVIQNLKDLKQFHRDDQSTRTVAEAEDEFNRGFDDGYFEGVDDMIHGVEDLHGHGCQNLASVRSFIEDQREIKNNTRAGIGSPRPSQYTAYQSGDRKGYHQALSDGVEEITELLNPWPGESA